jgi:hypothetical protein
MTTHTWHIDTWDERTSPAEKLGHLSGKYLQGRLDYVLMGEDVLPITVDEQGNLWLDGENLGWLPQVRTHHIVEAFRRHVNKDAQMRLL